MILEHQPAFLGPSSLHCPIPGDSSKQTFEEARVRSPEAQGCEPPPPRPQHPEPHRLMVAAAQAAFDPHIPNEPLLVGEDELQQSPPPRRLLCHLEEDVVIDALRSLLGCLCPAVSSLSLKSPMRTRFLGT